MKQPAFFLKICLVLKTGRELSVEWSCTIKNTPCRGYVEYFNFYYYQIINLVNRLVN